MKLYIVRHGTTDANEGRISQGHLKTRLNKKGINQAKSLAKRLSVVNFDFIYSSDLPRSVQTTKEILKFQDCPVKYVKDLREKNYGVWQGKSIDVFLEHIRKNKKRMSPGYRPLRGESQMDMYLRIIKFLELVYHKHKNQTILFSTHGGVKRAILRYLKNIPLAEETGKTAANASLTVVQFHENGKHKIELEGCVKHLNI